MSTCYRSECGGFLLLFVTLALLLTLVESLSLRFPFLALVFPLHLPHCTFSNSPYKDGILLAAQIFAVLAFLVSFLGMSLLVLVPLVLFLSTCCCSMNKCGLITSGVLGVLTAAVMVLYAVAITVNVNVNEDELRDTYGDKNYEAIAEQIGYYSTLMYAGASLWIIASVLVFSFACSSRYQQAVRPYETIPAVIV